MSTAAPARPRQIETRFFRSSKRPLTAEEQKKRDELRRAKTKVRTGYWRQRLYDRREPELRHMSDALLKAFVTSRLVDDPLHDLTARFLSVLTEAGYDPVVSLERAKKLRRALAG
jgi:hypothetical protein